MVRRFFHSPNTPSFYFRKKKPPPRISVIMFQSLSFSLPHPPTFRYYSFLFWEGGGEFKLDASDAVRRARQNTQESPIATACFGTSTSQTIGSRRSLIKLWAERCIQSSPSKKKKRYGLRIYLSSKPGRPPLKLIHTSRHEIRCKSQKR